MESYPSSSEKPTLAIFFLFPPVPQLRLESIVVVIVAERGAWSEGKKRMRLAEKLIWRRGTVALY
jgi:hypothetical protein